VKRIFILLLLVALWLCTGCLAEELPGLPELAQENGRIVGSMEIGRGFPLQVDMPVPKEIQRPVKQYKMRRIEIALDFFWTTSPQRAILLLKQINRL
jgi:hypothetical protein